MSNDIVNAEITNVNTANAETTTVNTAKAKAASKGNATKQQAAALADIVMDYRKARTQPSKVMSAFAVDVAGILMDSNNLDMIKAAAARAKAAAAAAIDEQMRRALELSKLPRGTTGVGGINRDDVVVEVFTSDKKSHAVERNTRALRAANRIS